VLITSPDHNVLFPRADLGTLRCVPGSGSQIKDKYNTMPYTRSPFGQAFATQQHAQTVARACVRWSLPATIPILIAGAAVVNLTGTHAAAPNGTPSSIARVPAENAQVRTTVPCLDRPTTGEVSEPPQWCHCQPDRALFPAQQPHLRAGSRLAAAQASTASAAWPRSSRSTPMS
jgi:hypothetical protein